MALILDTIQAQAYQFFVQEASDRIQQIEAELLSLRYDRGIPRIHKLVRAANAIRGGAISVGLNEIGILAGWLENTFRTFYGQGNDVEPEIEDLLLQAYFCLRIPLVAQIENGNYDEAAALAKAESVFQNIEDRLGCSLETAAQLPTTGELAANFSEEIFATDVSEHMEQLEVVLAGGDREDLIKVLKAKIELLISWGEILDLSEFVGIGSYTIAALLDFPEAALEIGKLALADFQTAHQTVLQGDRWETDKMTTGWTKYRSSSAAIDDLLPAWESQTQASPKESLEESILDPHSNLELNTRKLFVCLVDSVMLIVPCDRIDEIVSSQEDLIKQIGRQRFVFWQKRMIPLYRVAELLQYNSFIPQKSESSPTPPSLLIFTYEHRTFAFELQVERLIPNPEIVIKQLPQAIAIPHYIYGCTILLDNRLVPVLDGIDLLHQALGKERIDPLPATQFMTAIEQIEELEKTGDIKVPQIEEADKKPKIAAEPRKPPPLVSKPLPLLSPTVLIVDDSVTLRRVLDFTLQKVGYRVLEAEDGAQALTVWQKNRQINLIICDVEMPKMNGFEFLTYRRQDPLLAKVPVVMLTSRNESKYKQMAEYLGASGYFHKPCEDSKLLAAIKTILDDSRGTAKVS
jgi:chemotaxis protein histidine kinase CheA/CheY-like chemotaxis protein